MKFGPIPVAEAEGAVLAHSLATRDGRLRKGRVLTAADVAALAKAGHDRVIVAQPGATDVGENEAAATLGAAILSGAETGLAADAPFTGRVNIRASGPGVLQVDPAAIHAINAVDPGITLATLPEWQRVTAGMMVATVKIIPYAVPGAALQTAVGRAAGALILRRPVLETADLIVTDLTGTGAAEDKGLRAVAGRLDALGVALAATHVVPHQAEAVAQAIGACNSDLVLILPASATSDAADVGPAGLIAAGGTLTRFGMPVDPGNLLFVGQLGDRPVLGLPGCARSPALNGADWVLERVVCGVHVSDADIAAMGVGGLLKEIPTRPQPRERRPRG